MNTDWLQLISPCVRPVARVRHTGQSLHPPGWTEPLRVIYDHELVLVSRGSFRVEIAGEEYLCPAPSFLIIPPGRWHITWNTGQKAGQRHWSHFDWVWRGPYGDTPTMTFHPAKPNPRLYRAAPDFIPQAVFHGRIRSPSRAADLFERLEHRQVLGGQHDKLASRGLLLELLIELLDVPRESSPPGRPQSWLTHQVRERLRRVAEEGSSDASIQAALAELRYSYAHLARLFRAEYGITPLKYVHALRISRAKLLMSDTSLSISEIAFRVGFRDLSYFSQLFRKMTGRTPTAYRAGLRRR